MPRAIYTSGKASSAAGLTASVIKDEETGDTKTMKDLRVNDFNNKNTLPQPWIESIKDNTKAGDVILINKILFRNKEGKLQMAPDIRITVN